jgi:hypothetical protein
MEDSKENLRTLMESLTLDLLNERPNNPVRYY